MPWPLVWLRCSRSWLPLREPSVSAPNADGRSHDGASSVIVRLEGTIQHYHWGDDHTLASILDRRPSGQPEAEYWLGAHDKAPSRVVDPRDHASMTTLDQMISADPVTALGQFASERYDNLPFLFKVLAVAQPLSIQAHPDREQARAGFERENRAGIPLDSPGRNYRDANHKPELICAITPMEAKCGFRTLEGIRQVSSLFRSDAVAEVFSRAEPVAGQRCADTEQTIIRGLTAHILGLPDAERATLVDAVVDECRTMMEIAGGCREPQRARSAERGPIDEFELARTVAWTVRAYDVYGPDVGVVVALLLNHIQLAPGQGLFLNAGNVHAYLSGVGVELMANSDNVLRCGLTSKHIDVDELLAIADFHPGRPPRLESDGPEYRFEPPIPEFSLFRMVAEGGSGPGRWLACDVEGPEIVLVTGGPVSLESADERLELHPGQSVFVGAAESRFLVRLDSSSSVAWRATIGR